VRIPLQGVSEKLLKRLKGKIKKAKEKSGKEQNSMTESFR
jgi:hypothetical protein